MNIAKIGSRSLALATILLGFAACSNAKSYDIEGQVTSVAAVDGKIALEVFQIDTVDGKTTRASVFKTTLDKIGPFKEKVDLSPGAKALVRAVADKDGDGVCSAGEAWAEAQIDKLDDTKANTVSLALAANACPTDK
jgi:hypothetical protein